MPVTQQDMAKSLGVSQALVARALRDDPAVAAATRARVQAMARKLGYRPNTTARALLTGKTGLVGLWIARAYGTYSARVIFALEKLARRDGFDLIITDLNPDGEPSRYRLAVDGLIVADAPWQAEALSTSAGASPPCVGIGSLASDRCDAVMVDLGRGARLALAHLRELGRRRVAYMTAAHPLGGREARFRAFRSAHPKGPVIQLTEPTRAAARSAVLAAAETIRAVDALMCHNDDYAIGAIRGLEDLGLDVPGDVAVVGCDGVEDTEYLACPLTTIAIPVEAICELAWRYLLERISGLPDAPRRRMLQPELLVRESTTGAA